MFHKMDLPLLLLVVIIAIGLGEMISSVKLPEPPQDGAAGLHLHNGLDDCGEDTHSSCDSWAKSAECEMDPFVKQNCSFSCSISGRLWEAAWTGNLSAVDSAIAAGANTLCAKTSNVTNTLLPKTSNVTGDNLDNYTAIHMAASAGHPGIVNKLLIAGVDVNLQTTEGKTPIHIAVLSGSINALDILIENNGNVNLPDNNTINFFPGSTGWTPLMYAAWSGELNITRALIRANASLDVTGGSWNTTALNYAVNWGNQDVALLLIEHNANVHITSSDGDTPLIAAASNGQLNTTRALIKANASLDVIGGYRNATALYYAASEYNIESESNQDIALLLIEHDANVNIPSSAGVTPLIAAASEGELNITRALIKANASLDVTGGDYNATALFYAVRERYNQEDVALLLIEHNANVNIPSSSGWTPLIGAAAYGQLNITRALIKANASLDVTGGDFNATALYYAVRERNNQDVALLLIEHNANVNIPSSSGETPLMKAAAWYFGGLNITRALIKANASLDVTGGDYNATALYYAVRERYNQDMALLLIQHNANVNIPSSSGETPLMKVVNWSFGGLNITRALIKANASLDVTEGVYNATALHYAVESNFNQDLVVLLMDNGADSSITNNLGFTPADLARSKGHNQLADLIEGYPTTHKLILSR